MSRFALVLFFLCTPLFAQSPPFLIQRDGVIQFGANFLQHDPSSPTYNFCETLAACSGVTPPPIDPVDPLGMNTIIGKYADHSCTPLATSNGQDFGAIFGGTSYPYQPPKSAFFAITANKRYSAVWHMPLNPGTARHFLKADAYGGSCHPALVVNTAPFDWQVVAADTQSAAPIGTCSGSSFAGDRSAIFTINPSAGPATDNMSMCNVRFGPNFPVANYRAIVDPQIATAQPLILSWY